MKHIRLFEEFNQIPDKKIVSTYQVITPESSEIGDYEDQGWYDEDGESMIPDEFDIEDGLSAVDKAVKFLQSKGALEPSSSNFNIDVSYSTIDPDRDYKTGAETYYSYFLKGFTPEEQKEIFKKITLRPIKEGKKYDINPKYTHFAVLKSNNKIVNGWEYKGYDQEELNLDKEHYFYFDLRDLDIKPKDVSILQKKTLLSKNIDPFDVKNWSNNKE